MPKKFFCVAVTESVIHHYYVAAEDEDAARNLLEGCSNEGERELIALSIERGAYSNWEAEPTELTAVELAGPLGESLGYCPHSPTGIHEIDHAGIRPVDNIQDWPELQYVVDVPCRWCGRSGSTRLTSKEIQW